MVTKEKRKKTKEKKNTISISKQLKLDEKKINDDLEKTKNNLEQKEKTSVKESEIEKEEKMKKNIEKKINLMDKPIKKHHIWGGIGIIIGIIIALLIITLFSFKYLNYTEQESYVQGGEDMANAIYKAVNENGGAVIEVGGNKIIVAKYEKELPGDKIVK
jgi:hypothetical protein